MLQVIANAGLTIDHLQAVRREQGRTTLGNNAGNGRGGGPSLYARIDELPIARFVGKSDRVFDRHRGGKIKTVSTMTINSQQVLRGHLHARCREGVHGDPEGP